MSTINATSTINKQVISGIASGSVSTFATSQAITTSSQYFTTSGVASTSSNFSKIEYKKTFFDRMEDILGGFYNKNYTSLSIETGNNTGFLVRFWRLLTNPIVYLFYGKIKW